MNVRPALVALVVVLAGCSAAPVGTTGEGPASTPDATSTEPSAPSPSPTPSPGSSGSTASLDGSAVAERHVAVLEAVDSYRTRYRSVRHYPDETWRNSQVYAVNRSADRYRYAQGPEENRTTYTDGRHTVFRHVRENGSVAYDRLFPHQHGVTPVDTETAPHPALLEAGIDGANWTRAGETTYRGHRVTRYVARGTDAVPTDPLGSGIDLSGPNASANATLLLGADGVVYRYELHLRGTDDGRPVRESTVVAVRQVGGRVAPRPRWYDEARDVDPEVGRTHRITVTNGASSARNVTAVVRRDGTAVVNRTYALAAGEEVELYDATGVGNYTVVVRSAGEWNRATFSRTNRTRNCFGDRFLRFTVENESVELFRGGEPGGCPY